MTRVICRAVKEKQKRDINYIDRKIPNVEWVFDKNKSAFDTFLRALKKSNNKAVVFMECDVLLCKDFLRRLESEIEKRPNEILQFFSMRKDDLIIGTRRMNGSTFSMNQCHYFPKGMTNRLYDYYSQWIKTERGKKNPNGYDYMMADFFKEFKYSYWIICPNLVNHRKEKSLINEKRSSKRQSKTYESI
ncbi:MAG: glycosyltransferase family A protein [Candidatus Pacearchaeota archaeon]|jgi:hypothetical protein